MTSLREAEDLLAFWVCDKGPTGVCLLQRTLTCEVVMQRALGTWSRHCMACSGGGPQSMDLLYPPVDDLDDDVGIVDAEVLELLLSRPN